MNEMFIEAIEKAIEFTRPIHMIYNNFGSTNVYTGTATIFFVNNDGWFLTCRHVAQELIAIENLNKKYHQKQL